MTRVLRSLRWGAITAAPPIIFVLLCLATGAHTNGAPTVIAITMFFWVGSWTGYNWDRPDILKLSK